MSAAIRSIIIGVIGLLVAIVLGSELGTGFRIVPLSLAIIVVLFALYKLFLKALRLEALLLGILVFGYIVGNRGFAQLSLAPNSPLFLGEMGMVACVGILGARLALKREQIFPKTPLSWAIRAFLFIGGVRLFCDIFLHLSPANTVTTIRDSAVVYYSLFFFIGYKVGQDRLGRGLMEKCVLISCIALLPVFLIQFVIAPDLFYRMTFRGYPLISHKGDLTATYLAFASFYFFLYPSRGAIRLLLRILAIVFFLGIFVVTARAAIVGLIAAALLLLMARRPQFVLAQICVAVVGLTIAGALHLGSTGDESDVYTKVTDKLESMTDFSGSRNYRGEVGDYSADNNQFRTVWWRTVSNETLRKGPIFGLGFGYDLAAGFLRNYYSNRQDVNWDVRSPHSVWVTIFGRLGIVGLISFATIVFFLIRGARDAARRVARGETHVSTLAFWTGAIIILGSASFGVVLEGPMGGILFWTFLGLAESSPRRPPESPESKPRRPAMELRPIALAN
jgi:hypothetical protein